MDGDFGAAGGGFGDLDDFTQGPSPSLDTGSNERSRSSPFAPRSPRTAYGDPSGLSRGSSGGYDDIKNGSNGRGTSAFGESDNFPPLNGTHNSTSNRSNDDDPFLSEESGRRGDADGFVAEAYSFGIPNGVSAGNDSNNTYVPPTIIGGGEPSGGRGVNGFFEELNSVVKTQDTSRQISADDPSRQRSSIQQQQGGGAGVSGSTRPTGSSLELEIDEEARKAVAVVQEQMRKEVEARRKEEEDLKKEQRELAQEELKDFYERRRQQVERRSKANQ